LIPPAFLAVAVVFIAAVVIVPIIVPPLVVEYVGWALRARPEDYEGWCYYGRLLANRGRVREALDAFREAITLKPDYAEAWQRIGDLLATIGDAEGAAEAYKNVGLGDFGVGP
jgi:tetratricopeptide (TPR) repeat protein